jgi:translation initiation factor 5A
LLFIWFTKFRKCGVPLRAPSATNMADDFEKAESGASASVPTQASAIRKGGHVVIKGRPCKVVDTSTSKTGKHGGAKVHLTAIDIFTGKKYEELSGSTQSLMVPIVTRKDYTLLDVTDDGFTSLMAEDGDVRDDIKLPADQELANKMKEAIAEGKELIVSVLAAMGEEQIVAAKPSSA